MKGKPLSTAGREYGKVFKINYFPAVRALPDRDCLVPENGFPRLAETDALLHILGTEAALNATESPLALDEPAEPGSRVRS